MEGERAVVEVLAVEGVRFLFGTSEYVGFAREHAPGVEFLVIDDGDDTLFATDSPQGIAAVVNIPPVVSLTDLLDDAPLLVLDAVADPGNVGTIVRTVEWFGLGGIVLLPGTSDPYSPKSVRSSMGAIVRCRIARSDVTEVLDSGVEIVALDAGGERSLGASRLPRHAVYIVGSEAHGVSPALARRSQLLAIGGSGRVESLNAATAAAILCYELSRLDERS